MDSSCWVVTTASGSDKASDLKRAIDKLSSGRDLADELRAVLRESRPSSGLPAGALVDRILDSFADSISILRARNINGGDFAGHIISQVPPAALINSPSSPEDSGDTCKTTPAPSSKDRRGCYKRRRTTETSTKETPSLFEDGHAWRKYGQKVILNTKHPRNYYRCTHKYDQGCQATKQVQKIQDDPTTLYRTTYHGKHTCSKNPLEYSIPAAHQIILDDTTQDHHSSSIIWSFESRHPEYYNDHNQALPVKQEDYQLNKSSSSSSNYAHDYFISPHHHDFDNSVVNLSTFSSASGGQDNVISPDHVYSCTASTHDSIDMDMMSFDDLPEF